jgi:hypothetical protein
MGTHKTKIILPKSIEDLDENENSFQDSYNYSGFPIVHSLPDNRPMLTFPSQYKQNFGKEETKHAYNILPIIKLTPKELAQKLESLLNKKNVKPEIAIQAHQLIKANLTTSEEREKFYEDFPRLIEIMEANLPAEYLRSPVSWYDTPFEVSEINSSTNKNTDANKINFIGAYRRASGRKGGSKVNPSLLSLFNKLMKGNDISLTGLDLSEMQKPMGGAINGVTFNKAEAEDTINLRFKKNERHAHIQVSSLPIDSINYLADTFAVRTGEGKISDVHFDFVWGETVSDDKAQGTLIMEMGNLDLVNLNFIQQDETYSASHIKVNNFCITIKKEFSIPSGYADLMPLATEHLPDAFKFIMRAFLQTAHQFSNDIGKEAGEDIIKLLAKEQSDFSIDAHYDSLDIQDFKHNNSETIKEIKSGKTDLSISSVHNIYEVNLTRDKAELAALKKELLALRSTKLKNRDEVEIEKKIKKIISKEKKIEEADKYKQYSLTVNSEKPEIGEGNYLNNLITLGLKNQTGGTATLEEKTTFEKISFSTTLSSQGIANTSTTLNKVKIPILGLKGPLKYQNKEKTTTVQAQSAIFKKTEATVTLSLNTVEGQISTFIEYLHANSEEVEAIGPMIDLNGKQFNFDTGEKVLVSGFEMDMTGDELQNAGASKLTAGSLDMPSLMTKLSGISAENIKINIIKGGGVNYQVSNLTTAGNYGETKFAVQNGAVKGTYENGISKLEQFILPDISLSHLHLNTDKYSITVPESANPIKLSQLNASVEFKMGEKGLEYLSINTINRGSISAYGMQVVRLADKMQLINLPIHKIGTVSGLHLSGFKFTETEKTNKQGKTYTEYTREVIGDKGIASISGIQIPSITANLAGKLFQAGNIKMLTSGEIKFEQSKGSDESKVTANGLYIEKLLLPQLSIKDGQYNISVPFNKNYPSILSGITVQASTNIDAKGNPLSVSIPSLHIDRLKAFGLKITNAGKPMIELPAQVPATLSGVQLNNIQLNDSLNLTHASGTIDSSNIETMQTNLEGLFVGDTGLRTGRISFSTGEQGMNITIENPDASLFKTGTTQTGDKEKGSLYSMVDNNGILNAEKIVIKTNTQGQTITEIHNPWLLPVMIQGKSLAAAGIENYSLELGGTIKGVLTVKEENGEWVIEAGDEVMMHNIRFIMGKPKGEPGTDFENLTEEELLQRENDESALGLYEADNHTKFDFLDYAISGMARINLFGECKDINIVAIKTGDKVEYGFIDLKSALENISSILKDSGKINEKDLNFIQIDAIKDLSATISGENYLLEVGSSGKNSQILVPNVEKNVIKINGIEYVRLSALINYQTNKPETIPDASDSNASIIGNEIERLMSLGNFNVDLMSFKLNPAFTLNMGILAPLNLSSDIIINSNMNLNETTLSEFTIPKFSYNILNNKGNIEASGLTIQNFSLNYSHNKNIALNADLIKIKALKFKLKK